MHQISTYLTPEACAAREHALIDRVAREAVEVGPGLVTWQPESDFWLLTPGLQLKVRNWLTAGIYAR